MRREDLLNRDELIEILSEQARQRGRSRRAVWWNGELVGVEQAIARAAELDDGDTALLSHGEIMVNPGAGRLQEVP